MATNEDKPERPRPVKSRSYRKVLADKYEGASAYQDEIKSITSSVTSAAIEYNYTHGRRFYSHKDGAYIYPVDEKESERLDLTHKMIELAMDGKLHLSPIQKPKRVLDIGAGTGIWSVEFGEKHPESEVIGNDLSPVQPAWVPPNVHFDVDDVEKSWVHSHNFDFIHCRCMGSAIRDWPRLMKQVFEHLNPGGYAEFIDFDVEYVSPDDSLETGSEVHQLNRMYIDETRKYGVEPCPGKFLQEWMKETGFDAVAATKRFLPLGTWPKDKHLKEVGAWNFMMVDENLEGFLTYLYANILGMSKEQLDECCAGIRKQFRDPKVHCMYTLHICYGRKPEISRKVSVDVTEH